MKLKKGILISFEGGEGCGKTTQLEKIKTFLDKMNCDYVIKREPGGCPISEELRQIVLHSKQNINPRAEALIYAASRAQLFEEVISPSLEEGKIVILDRYFDSSIAYQGVARGLGAEEVYNLSRFAINGRKPDITFYLRITAEDAFRRKGGADTTDRMEMAGLDFHNKVTEGYDMIAKNEPERVVIIDATKTIDEMHNDIVKALTDKYPEL